MLLLERKVKAPHKIWLIFVKYFMSEKPDANPPSYRNSVKNKEVPKMYFHRCCMSPFFSFFLSMMTIVSNGRPTLCQTTYSFLSWLLSHWSSWTFTGSTLYSFFIQAGIFLTLKAPSWILFIKGKYLYIIIISREGRWA